MPTTPATPAPPTTFDGMASSSVDFSRFIDSTPVTVHPRLPLETVMELFRKIGPRVILIEYHGKLAGLVTVKDCLKYQFKVEASENPRDDSRLIESQAQLWGIFQMSAGWISRGLERFSGGRIRIGSNELSSEGQGLSSTGGPRSRILDGTEEDVDDGVELENR